jgi:hypothetical protein
MIIIIGLLNTANNVTESERANHAHSYCPIIQGNETGDVHVELRLRAYTPRALRFSGKQAQNTYTLVVQ